MAIKGLPAEGRELAGQVALVTGGAKNIGRAISIALAAAGAAAAVRAMGEGVMKRFGKIDILVLNASQRREVLFKDMTFEDWRNTMSITLDGSFHCIKACLPSMLANRCGNIVMPWRRHRPSASPVHCRSGGRSGGRARRPVRS